MDSQTIINSLFSSLLTLLIIFAALQHNRINSLEESIQFNRDNIELNRDRTSSLVKLVLEMVEFDVYELNLHRSQKTMI